MMGIASKTVKTRRRFLEGGNMECFQNCCERIERPAGRVSAGRSLTRARRTLPNRTTTTTTDSAHAMQWENAGTFFSRSFADVARMLRRRRLLEYAIRMDNLFTWLFLYSFLMILHQGSGNKTVSTRSTADATIDATASVTMVATVFATTLVPSTELEITTEDSNGTVETWVWVVVAVGALLLVVAVTLIVICCVRRYRKREPPAPVGQDQEGDYGNLNEHGEVDIGKAPRNSLPEGFRGVRGNGDDDEDDDYADEYLKPDQMNADSNQVYQNLPATVPLAATASPRRPPPGGDLVNPAFQLHPIPPATPVMDSLPGLPLPPPPEQLSVVGLPPQKPLPLPPPNKQNIGGPKQFQLPLPILPTTDFAPPVRVPTPRPSPVAEEGPAFIPPSNRDAASSPRRPPPGSDLVNPAFQLPPIPPATPVVDSSPGLPLPPPPEQLSVVGLPPQKPLPLPPPNKQNIGGPRQFQLPLPILPTTDPAPPVRVPTPRPSPVAEEGTAFIPPSNREELPLSSPPPAPLKSKRPALPSKVTSPISLELKLALEEKMNDPPTLPKVQINMKKKNKKEIPVPQRIIDENEVISETISLRPFPGQDYGGEYEEMEHPKSRGVSSFHSSPDADYGGTYETMSPANTMKRDADGHESGSSSDSESYEIMLPVIAATHTPRMPAEADLEHRLPMPLPPNSQANKEDYGEDYEEIDRSKPQIRAKPQTAKKPNVAPKQKRPVPPPKNSKPPDDDFEEEYTNTNTDIGTFAASQRPPPSMPKQSPSTELTNMEQQDKGDPVYMNLPSMTAKLSEHYRNLPNPPQTEQVGGYTDSWHLRSWQRADLKPS